jgi:hypothetical protein
LLIEWRGSAVATNRLVRAPLYGLMVWLGLVAISLILLPSEESNRPLHESIKLTALVGVLIGASILYLGRFSNAGWVEAALVGVLWAAVCIGLDLVLYAVGAFNIGLGKYFNDVASSYMVMPVVTTLVIGVLRRR